MSTVPSIYTDNIYYHDNSYYYNNVMYNHEASRLTCRDIPDLALRLEMQDCSGNLTVIICMQSSETLLISFCVNDNDMAVNAMQNKNF